MKKTILVVVMLVMVTTPCLAEIEPDGSFSLHGTQWSIFEFLIFPFWLVFKKPCREILLCVHAGSKYFHV